MTIRGLIDRYLRALDCKRPESVRQQTRAVIALLGRRRAEELRGADIQDYRERRRGAGVSDATVNRELSYLRAAYRRAIEDEELERMPVIRMAREAAPRQRFIYAEELERLCAAMHPDDADLVEFLFATGWRRGAALGLDWGHVLEDRIILPGSLAKNGRPMSFPLVGRVAAIIARRRARRANERQVFGKDGAPRRYIRRFWKTACRRAGLEGLRIHDLRRSFLNSYLTQGVPLEAAMRLGGWASVQAATRYLSLTNGLDLRWVRQAERGGAEKIG